MARAPGQELRVLLFAMLVLLLVQLAAGDEFYGSHGVVFWFIGGQVLAYDSVAVRPTSRRARGDRLRVELLQAVDDARPGVALLDHLAVVRAHRPRSRRRQQLRQRGGQRRGVARAPPCARRASSTRCCSPPARVATTGLAQAMASSAVMPKGSP